MSTIEKRLEEGLRDIRRALVIQAEEGVAPQGVRILVRRANEALGYPTEMGLGTKVSRSRREPLPMLCAGEKADPSGGCWFCGGPPDRPGPRCPRRDSR